MREMSPLAWLIISSALLYHLVEVTSYPTADLIKCLPGQPPVQFQQFAGYVPVDETLQRQFFYYFVEAECNPESKPLVLWLNGGPGCSSVGHGAFVEHGPFMPTSDALIKNDHSWNKEANMLYLESPAGVGFSYSSNISYYNYVDDEMTARDNLVFLQKWLEKFPEYKNRDLFLSGESYAGHYVPQLALLILNSPLKPNLKGIAIGNPLLEFCTDLNSRADYLWAHGLLSDATFGLLQTQCNFSQIRAQSTINALSPACAAMHSQIKNEMGALINGYDIPHDRCVQMPSEQGRVLTETAKTEIDVCINDKTTNYLNRKDVQEALHAQLVGVSLWMACNGDKKGMLRYNKANIEVPTLPLLGDLTKAGVRVWVYSGDQDSVIPLIGTRKLVRRLADELKLNATIPYRSWLEADGQVGGFTEVYGDFLSFITIRGAGHETPFSQPTRSFFMFSSFLQGKFLPGPPPPKDPQQ